MPLRLEEGRQHPAWHPGVGLHKGTHKSKDPNTVHRIWYGVYGLWYMVYEHKDPTNTMVFGIPLVLGLSPRM